MQHKDAIFTETLKFVPFREANILPRFQSSFRISDPSIRISSASAFYPATAGICQNVFPRELFVEHVSLDKTYNAKGLDDLMNGRIDLFVSYTKEDKLEEVQSRVPLLKKVVLLYDPLAFYVHADNKVRDLSAAQIRDIYTGKIQNWKELGDSDETITTYHLTSRANVSGAAFDNIVSGIHLDANHQERDSMPEIVDTVADDSSALANIFWSYYAKMYANKNTRLITVDGKNCKDKDYPFLFPIYMFYDGANPKQQLHQLVQYLQSEEGQDLIRVSNKCQRKVK